MFAAARVSRHTPGQPAPRPAAAARFASPATPMKPSHALKTVPAALLAAAVLAPAHAGASTSQVTIMEDEAQTVVVSDKHRAKYLDEMKALGADVVKVRVRWRDIAPKPTKK